MYISMEDQTVYSGVYKINFPNGKSYIGISNNMHRRMNEHNCDFRNNLPIEQAIKKYGPITEYEILEIIPPEQRNYMRERECYWIKHFQTANRNKGYNVSPGGDGADFGAKNVSAKLTQEQVEEIYVMLKNDLDVPMTEIAQKYDIHISTLSKLNNGVTYYNSNISYPIRTPKMCKKLIAGINSSAGKCSKETLEQIIFLLKNTKLSTKEIEQITGIKQEYIRNINNGKTYVQENLTYPLRKLGKGSKQLTQNQVLEIIELIKNSDCSLASIATRYNVSSKTVSGINCGTTYRQKDITYPIRICK